MQLLLALCFALSCISAIPVPGKEIVYDYNARIRVGSYEPVSYASQFILEGKLHLQYESANSLLLRFTDLTYKLYNGKLNQQDEYQSTALPLGKETVDLLRVFRVEYDEDGKLRYITTETGERKFSRNIKKAIASLLQLDRRILQLDWNTPHAFITEERSIYGRGLEEYNIIPQGEEIVVQKMRDVKNSRHWYSYLGMNVEAQYNSIQLNTPISINSHRQYTLNQVDGKVVMKRLESHGGIYLHMLKGLTDAQYISVNQTLNLLEIIPIEKNYRINNEDRTNEIEFHFETETETGAIGDITFGRRHLKQDQVIEQVEKVLDDAVSYLQSNQLNVEAPDAKKGQAINRLHQLVGQLTIPSLELVYSVLEERNGERDKLIFKVFQQVLPLVGSRATVVFIRNLIRKNKVEDDVKIDMLNKLPFYLRMRSEKILEEVEELTNLQNASISVNRAAVLCFASMVHQVFAHRSHVHQNNEQQVLFRHPGNWNWHLHEHPHHNKEHRQEESTTNTDDSNVNSENQLLERYILKFVKLLATAEDYQSQFLYMQALYNIQVGNVSKHLESYVTGTAQRSNRHLQFLAMCAAMAGDVQDPERVYRIYWPIFTNRKLHVELRAGAYFVIMSTRPTMSKLWNIYWVMHSEPCPELYHFVYTHLQSISSSKNPAVQELKVNAAQILKYIRKPYRRYSSGNYVFDYNDPKYDFGATVQSMFIATKTSRVLYIDLTNHVGSIPLQLYSLFIKIDGLDTTIIDRLPKDKILRFNIGELDQVMKILSILHENKNLHLEYSVLHQNQVVRIEYYDQHNIKQLVDNIQNLQIENIKMFQNSFNIQYNLLTQIVLPNDLGFPTVIQMKSPRVSNNIINIGREIVNKIVNIQADVRLHTSMQTSLDVGFYNPVVDVWQGIQRINAYDHVLPVNLNLAINTQQNSVKLTLNRNQDQEKGTIGVRNHVRSIVYVFGDETHQYLKQSNEKCKVVEEVSRGREHRKEISLLEIEDENTGRRYEVKVFDNERPITRRTMIDLLHSVFQRDNKNDNGLPVMNLLLSIRNLWSRLVLLPGFGTSGFIIRALPSAVNPVSHIDLSFRYNQELNREENVHLPSSRINTRATYSVKHNDSLLKTWDVNTIVDLNPGHTVSNVRVQIGKIVPDQKDFRICIDGTKKWLKAGVSGHISIAIGSSTDNKCPKNETLIDINMTGAPDKKLMYYDKCNLEHLYEPYLDDQQMSHYLSSDCIQRHTSIRKYVYDIKATKVPQYLAAKLTTLTRLYVPYYTEVQRVSPVEENSLKVIIDYTPDNEIDLKILGSQEEYNITGIRIRGIQSDNYHYSRKFMALERFGLIKSCFVNNQKLLNALNNVIDKEIGDDWVNYVMDNAENPVFSVAVKRIQEQAEKIGLRVVSGDQILEIIPDGDEYQIQLNGNQISVEKNSYHQEPWFSVGVLNDDQLTLILQIHNYGLYVNLNGAGVKIDVAVQSNLVGACFGDE